MARSWARAAPLILTLRIVGVRSACALSRVAALLVIAKRLPPSQFAVVAVMGAIAEVAKVIIDAGVDIYSLREYGMDRAAVAARAVSVGCTKLVMMSFGTAALLLILYCYAPDIDLSDAIAISLFPALQLGLNFFLNLSLAGLSQRVVITAAACGYACYFLFLVAALLLPGDAARHSLTMLAAMEAMLLIIGLRWGLRQLEPLSRRAFSEVTSILRRALPVGVAAIIAIMYSRLDLMVLKLNVSQEVLGFYAFAARLVDPFTQIIAGCVAAMGGHYASLWAKGIDAFDAAALRLRLWVSGAAILIVLAMALSASTLLEWMFPAFVPATNLVILFSLLLIPRIYNNATTTLLIAAHRERATPIISVVNLIILAVLLFMLAGRYGAPGVIVALLVTECINSMIQTLVLRSACSSRRVDSSRTHQGAGSL